MGFAALAGHVAFALRRIFLIPRMPGGIHQMSWTINVLWFSSSVAFPAAASSFAHRELDSLPDSPGCRWVGPDVYWPRGDAGKWRSLRGVGYETVFIGVPRG
jgi:hypothetical protein